jgi:hypothetical protein
MKKPFNWFAAFGIPRPKKPIGYERARKLHDEIREKLARTTIRVEPGADLTGVEIRNFYERPCHECHDTEFLMWRGLFPDWLTIYECTGCGVTVEGASEFWGFGR